MAQSLHGSTHEAPEIDCVRHVAFHSLKEEILVLNVWILHTCLKSGIKNSFLDN
jgi:hypothetical protein